MQAKTQLDRVLVVLNPELDKPDAILESALIRRAAELAKATGCELELFHVYHDPSLEQSLFASDAEVMHEREVLGQLHAERIAKVALKLNDQGITVQQDLRWDYPRADAILRKIDEARPDLVLKTARHHEYLVGLTANTDWELIRHSKAHLWFVKDGTKKINQVLTAVGTGTVEEDIISSSDYNVFAMARNIAARFGAECVPVHAYQVPRGMDAYTTYAPDLGGTTNPESQMPSREETRRELARQHGQAIRDFAKHFNIDPDRVEIAEGEPSNVVHDYVESLDADLVVMGARNLSRWQRFIKQVTAEPVLSDTPCDVVFIKEASSD